MKCFLRFRLLEVLEAGDSAFAPKNIPRIRKVIGAGKERDVNK